MNTLANYSLRTTHYSGFTTDYALLSTFSIFMRHCPLSQNPDPFWRGQLLLKASTVYRLPIYMVAYMTRLGG